MSIFDVVKATGKEIDGSHIELEIQEGEFKGVMFYYEGMKFADKENDDGSMTMNFDYQVTSEFDFEDYRRLHP
jgi:hypothetical protein